MAFDESLITTSVDQQDFYTTTLKQIVADGTDTNIYLNTLPTPSEGFLTLEPTNTSKREIIYYTSKGADYVTVPSAANGRGVGGTSAQGHASGVEVRLTDVAEYWRALKKGFGFSAGTASLGIPASAIRTEAWATHSSVITGFSGTPTQTVKYFKIGRIVFIEFDIQGTSNSSSFTFTLPYASSRLITHLITGNDAGSPLTNGGRLDTGVGTAVANVTSTPTGGGFTASGTKTANGSFFYEATS